MQKIKEILSKYSWLLIILFSIPAIYSLLKPGFYGASDDIHIAWLHQMDTAIGAGKFPPRFVPDLSYGFGYPLFNFVFPLPFYFAELFHLMGFSLVASIKIVFILTIPLSMYFMYKLLGEFTSKSLSFAGAVLYVYTPYRATEIYVRGAIGEIVIFVFLPLVLLSITKITERGKINIRWIGICALSIFGLITSHNITSYMFFPAIILFLIIKLVMSKQYRKTSLVSSILAISLGLLSSIYFWLPALKDSALMKYDTVFNYFDHFPTIKQLITPYFGYGASVAGPYDGMSFFIGLVSLVVISTGVVLLVLLWKKYSKNQKSILVWSTIVLLVSLLLMNHRSMFLWEVIPNLKFFQFPWRFLLIVTFISPLYLVSFDVGKRKDIIALLVIILSLITTASFFKPYEFLQRQDDYYLNRYIPTPVASDEYRETSEEYLRLPVETEMRPERNYDLIESEGLKIIDAKSVNSLDSEFVVYKEGESVVNINKYNFPGWKVMVDGNEVEISTGKPFGQIIFHIPQGDHVVKVFYSETTCNLFLDIISIMSIIISVSFICFPKKVYSYLKKSKKNKF